MPVCIGCGASYDDSEKLCPYCGRYKPEAQKVEINVKVTEEAGKLTCPSCRRADKVQKISAIIANQTYSIDAHMQQGSAVATQTSLLVQNLTRTPAKPPKPKNGDLLRFLGYLSFIYVVICIFMALFPGEEEILRAVGVQMAVVFGFVGFVLLRIAKGKKVKAIAAKKQIAQWQVAMDKYGELFYCSGCDCVYIPGKGTFAPVQKMQDYLYSV